MDEDELGPALETIRAVLADLGIGPDDLTRQTYTGAVAARRGWTLEFAQQQGPDD